MNLKRSFTLSGRVSSILAVGLILAISIGGMWLLRKATPVGMGINTDSVYYVNGARNLLTGNGFYRNSGEDVLKPITHFPPLFAYVLSLVGLFGMDPLRGGRLIIILLYGVNSLLFAWLVWKLTKFHWLAAAGAFLMSFSSVNLSQSAWLMSEPLYLSMMLVIILVAREYFKDWKTWPVILIGLLSGLMYLTRYVGLSIAVTWLVVIIIFIPGWHRKALHTGLFLLAWLPFVLGIMLRNYFLTNSINNRNLIIHWAPFEKVATGIRNLWGWFLPTEIQAFYSSLEWVFIALFFILFISALGVFIFYCLRVMRGQGNIQRHGLLLMLVSHVFIYLAAIYMTMNFYDATTIFDNRMLLPIYMVVLLLILVAVGFVWSRNRHISHTVIIIGSLVVMGLALGNTIRTSASISLDGLGFIDNYRRTSMTMAYIREHDMVLFYTNQPPTVYIQTGKSGYMVPSPVDALTLQSRTSYDRDLAEMKAKINTQDGFLVFFYEPGYETDPWYLDLTSGLVPMENLPDGIIWGRVE
jgi:hypothetical protein